MKIYNEILRNIIKESVVALALISIFFAIGRREDSIHIFIINMKIINSICIVALVYKLLELLIVFLIFRMKIFEMWLKLYVIFEIFASLIVVYLNSIIHDKYVWIGVVSIYIYSVRIYKELNTIYITNTINNICDERNKSICKHSKQIIQLENTKDKLNEKKNELINQLRPYVKKTLFYNPLKAAKEDFLFSNIEEYKDHIPEFKGEKIGFIGKSYKKEDVNRFIDDVRNYQNNLESDRGYYQKQLNSYQELLNELDRYVKIIIKDGEIISFTDDVGERIGIESDLFESVRANDITNAINYIKKFKILNEINKKQDELRRKNIIW